MAPRQSPRAPNANGRIAAHNTPPEKVSDQEIPSDRSGSVGFSAAVLPYLHAPPNSFKAATELIRLSTQRNARSGLFGKNADYCDQCLALFSTGFSTGKFSFARGGELNVEWNRG